MFKSTEQVDLFKLFCRFCLPLYRTGFISIRPWTSFRISKVVFTVNGLILIIFSWPTLHFKTNVALQLKSSVPYCVLLGSKSLLWGQMEHLSLFLFTVYLYCSLCLWEIQERRDVKHVYPFVTEITFPNCPPLKTCRTSLSF